MPRACDELAESEPDAALRDVEEAHVREAPRQVDADRRGRVGRPVRADDDLVVASEPIEEGEQALGVRHQDRLLVVDGDGDRERGGLRHGGYTMSESP